MYAIALIIFFFVFSGIIIKFLFTTPLGLILLVGGILYYFVNKKRKDLKSNVGVNNVYDDKPIYESTVDTADSFDKSEYQNAVDVEYHDENGGADT